MSRPRDWTCTLNRLVSGSKVAVFVSSDKYRPLSRGRSLVESPPELTSTCPPPMGPLRVMKGPSPHKQKPRKKIASLRRGRGPASQDLCHEPQRLVKCLKDSRLAGSRPFHRERRLALAHSTCPPWNSLGRDLVPRDRRDPQGVCDSDHGTGQVPEVEPPESNRYSGKVQAFGKYPKEFEPCRDEPSG